MVGNLYLACIFIVLHVDKKKLLKLYIYFYYYPENIQPKETTVAA